MREFVELVREQAALEGSVRGYSSSVGEPIREATLDRDGRFGWILPVNGSQTRVLMPGVELAEVQRLGATAPCLVVNGEFWWWRSAVYSAVPLPRRES